MMTNVNYDLSSYFSASQQNVAADEIQFRASYVGDCYATRLSLTMHESLFGIINHIMTAMKNEKQEPKVVCHDFHSFSIRCAYALVTTDEGSHKHSDLWTPYDRSLNINLYGDERIIKSIVEHIKANIRESTLPLVTWEFLAGDDRRSESIAISKPKPIFNEFYPWIGDVFTYFDDYLKSDSSILVLLGETGTAKTSFIRSLIWHGGLNTMFTYEEELLGSDSLFVDFIADEDMGLLVIEDADLMLTNREHDGNKVMSKFLNVSDGLADIGKKKIVFTANITDLAKIDNALLRPGRCFGCQVFRRLTYQEACAAANVANIPLPEVGKTYTLAELFAGRQPIIPKSIGFVG
jgi:hypothetical protein